MKSKLLVLVLFLSLSVVYVFCNCLMPKTNTMKVEEKWSIKNSFKTPESVIYDKYRNSIYVSNINGDAWEKDGNGFISKVSIEGKIVESKWISGLDAPKGMAIYKNYLYVTNINEIVKINIINSKIDKRIETKATFLNDITVDENGTFYISDNADHRIYIMKDEKVELWIDKGLKGPNGVWAGKNELIIASIGTGIIRTVNYDTKTLKNWKEIDNAYLDGIVPYNDGYLVSNFDGEIYFLSDDYIEKIVDTKSNNDQAADITYIPELKLLLVPTFSGNSITTYELSF